MATGSLKESSKTAPKGNVPFWLLVLALVLVLAAFSRAGDAGGNGFAFDGIAFDLGHADDSAADAGRDGYSAVRPSNHAFALLRLDGGRFVALYGPRTTDAASGAAPAVAGVLIGDGEDRGGSFASDNLHDFSLESGVLRVAAQEGRFTPARFVEGDTVRASAGPDRPAIADALAGRYAGRLSDLTGAGPATLSVDADGTLAIQSERCNARGSADLRDSAPYWPLQATFEAGCAHHGERLRGHAWRCGGALVVVLTTRALDGGALFVGGAAPR